MHAVFLLLKQSVFTTLGVSFLKLFSFFFFRIFTQLEKNAQLAISAMEGVEEEGKSQDEAKSQDGAVTQDKAIITSDLKLGGNLHFVKNSNIRNLVSDAMF